MYIFALNNIDEIFDIADLLKKNSLYICQKSELYIYKNKKYLYLYLKYNIASQDSFDTFISDISEISCRCKWGIINESILHEWGELVCSDIIKKIVEVI